MVKHRRKIHKSLSSSSSSSSSSTSSGKINVEENIGGFCGGDRVEVDETPLIDNSNVDIIVDDVTNNDKQRWSQLYSSPPIIDSKLILLFGIFIFGLSYTMIGRPLILLVFYMLSRFIPYAFRTNDNAVERRIQFKQFSKYPYHSDKFLNISNYVNLHESYWENDRGMLLCTSIMTPKDNKPIVAVAYYCHGYTDHASFAKRVEFQRLVNAGIALVTIEYEGHGRSDGPLGLIPSFDQVIMDVTQFFQHTMNTNPLVRNKPSFLIGESMGGAVIYGVYNKIPSLWKGCVFVCPMCKVKEEMLPPKFVIDLVRVLTGPKGTVSTIGYLPIAPSKKMEHLTLRMPALGQYVRTSPTCFSGRQPRLATARELLSRSEYISKHLHEFNAPFLVIHGKEDKVTDPVLSQMLYEEAQSTDKSIQLYDGLWHALTAGETNENIDMVFNDIIQWIVQRS